MIDINDVLGRITTIAKNALSAAGVTADAVAYFDHTQGYMPYMTIRVSNVAYGDYQDTMEDYATDVYTIVLRLVIAHLSADYDGRNEYRLYEMIPVIREGLRMRELLQIDGNSTAVPYLRTAIVQSGRGLVVFNNAGVDTQTALQVGTEFTIEATFDYPINQSFQ
jgi:hypothetical protein